MLHLVLGFVFSGSLVPILNKVLTSASYGQFSEFNEHLTMPSIVRVEPSDKSQQPIVQTSAEPQQTQEANEGTEDGEVVVTPAVGDKIARLFGSIILSGKIEVSINLEICCMSILFSSKFTFAFICILRHCKGDQGGSHSTRFTDGCCINMDIEELKEAKQLYESELKKLLEAKVSSCVIETQRSARRPILAEGEGEETEETERIYEEEYSGDVPSVLVGLQFPKRDMHWYSQLAKADIKMPLWQFVLRKLSERLLEEGAASSLDLLNLENLEDHRAE
jgi:hypothetical protein